jgi:AraC-like DNA-binding protein
VSSHSFVFETSDLDEARELCRSFYYPVSMDVVGRLNAFRYSLKVGQFGPATVGEAANGGDLTLSCGDLETAYHVNMPTSGEIESEHRGRTVLADPHWGAVYQPVGESRMRRWRAETSQLTVKIERIALETHLQATLGRPIRTPLDLAPSLDVSRGMGRSWLSLVQHLVSQLGHQDSLVNHPLVTDRIGDLVMAGLLLAVEHPYRDELSRPAVACRPRPVKRAIDAMEADPAYPFTAAELARAASISVRALQEGFRRHTGMSPIGYLRQVRLARVHEDLCGADPMGVTVADVAHRWGFVHLGRFAASYRRRYGQTPSATLRGRP